MVDPTITAERIEQRKDLGTGDPALYAYWMAQEAIAEREEREWIKDARKIVERYRDQRGQNRRVNRFNILWSNTELLKSALYSRVPKADVQRRFKDQDPIGRLASIVLERALNFACDGFDFDGMMRAIVEDRLLPGRGAARVLYIPHYGEEIDDKQPQQAVGYTQQAQNPNERCSACKHFIADKGTCELVRDPIYPDGWCKLFNAAAPGEKSESEFDEEDAEESDIASPGDEQKKPEAQPKLRKVIYEEVVARYVFWEDYREGPARQWHEVPWVRYRAYMTRDELIKRFGKAKGSKVELDYTPKGLGEATKEEPPPDLHKMAQVYETWDKVKGEVVWFAPGTPDLILDQVDDPLRLPGFFPGPPPLLATTTNDKRVPVPDYHEYRDQADELDRLTARIDKLTRALKVVGVYPGEEKQVIQQLLDEGTENRLVPVGDWNAWSEKGGLKSFIEWLPIQQIAQTLIQLYEARDKVKATLYEITGIGDIVRGNTIPDETATAQQLKASFSTRRIEPQQKSVARFARDTLRLMAGVIQEHFSPETLSLITGYPQLQPVPQLPPQPKMPQAPMAQAELADPNSPPQPNETRTGNGAISITPTPEGQAFQQAMKQWQQQKQAVQGIEQKNAQLQQQFNDAVQLLRKEGMHAFRIDIEADSTIEPDEQEEKANRVEFLQQFVPMLENVIPLAQGNPALANLAKEITLFAMRGFNVARPLEESVEQAFEAIAQMPPPPKDGGGGADSPADLAERRHETDTRAKIDTDKNRLAEQKLALEATTQGQRHALDTAKLAHDQVMGREHLLEERQTHAEQSDFRNLRARRIEGEEARGLT